MNEIKDEKRFLQILKKEKEYGQGSIFYIAGIITWVLGIIVSCIRYLGEMGEMTSEDIDPMPVIILGGIIFIVGIILMAIGKASGDYSAALLAKKYTVKEISNISYEEYPQMVYVKGLDAHGQECAGELCKMCYEIKTNAQFQNAYYVEVNGKKLYKRVVLL